MTTKPRYIWVKNWERYQDPRTPNWIRLWAKGLLHHDGFLELTDTQVTLLVGVWMLTSQTGNGRLSADIGVLNGHLSTSKTRRRFRQSTLDSLRAAGFITLRSQKAPRPLGVGSQLEKRREEKKISPPTPSSAESGGGGGSNRNGRAPRPMRTAAEREEYNRFLASIGAPPLPPEELDP